MRSAYGMVLWDRTFDMVKERYPDVETDSMLIDRACMEMIRAPEQFDVIVASNLFGDILTDIGAMVTGSMGLAQSANLNPVGNGPSMFEPTHGTAPDIEGKGLANPMAQILTGAMMLRHLGENGQGPASNSRSCEYWPKARFSRQTWAAIRALPASGMP